MSKIGRNDPCPCGSGIKYKKCCEGEVPWEQFFKTKEVNPLSYLSARGKNLLFIDSIAEALQLDNKNPPKDWRQIKKACTPKAVKKIHEAIPEIWIDRADLLRLYKKEGKSTSGLYVGTYEPESIFKGLTRHSLYADTILLLDPFMDPRTVRPEFSPVEKPEEHVATTLQNIYLWFSLTPWIEAGLVKFIKTPGAFDIKLHLDCMTHEQNKMDQSPEFKKALEEEADTRHMKSDFFESFKQYFFLCQPDSYIVHIMRELTPDIDELEIQKRMKYIDKLRDEHPYYVPPVNKKRTELHAWSTGTNYEMAKITASLTNAYLITDLRSRWKEIELDRNHSGVKDNQWWSFAKAFQELEFKFLENVPLDAALRIRKENRLDALRSFLRRIWRMSDLENELDDKNTQFLSDELDHHIREAETEWNKIGRYLATWLGLETAAATAMIPEIIASGHAEMYGIGFGLAGITQLAASWYKRKEITKRYPASFFLSLK